VGITRARRQLTFSLAGSRALFGELKRNPPSRFLGEVPRELFAFAAPAKARPQKERLPGESYVERDADISLDASDGFGFDEFDQRPPHERRSVAPMRRRNAKLPVRPSVPQLEVGARVVHDSFGEGFVTASSGGGANATVTVQFETVGEKRIVARFLRLLV
jgi:DNA helicase-2/ATP-dependent DNA helicase PcrA